MIKKYYIAYWSDIKDLMIYAECRDKEDMEKRFSALIAKGRYASKYYGILPHNK